MAKKKRGRPPNKYVLGQNENGEPIYRTYKDMGLTRKMAWECVMMATVPEDLREDIFARAREEGRQAKPELVRLGRYFHGLENNPDERFRIKPDDPADAAWQIARRCTPGYIEELIDFLREYLAREK